MKITKTIKLPSGTVIPEGTNLNFGNESKASYAGDVIVADSIPGIAMEALTITRNQLDNYIKLIAKDLKAKNRYDVEVDDKTHFLKAKLSNGIILVFDIATTNVGRMIAYSIDGEKFYDLPSDIKSYKDFRGKLKAMQAFAAKAKDSDEVQLDKITKSEIESKPQIVEDIGLNALVDKIDNILHANAPEFIRSFAYVAKLPKYKNDDAMKLGAMLMKHLEHNGITEQLLANAIERDIKGGEHILSEWNGGLDLILNYVLRGNYVLGLGYTNDNKGDTLESLDEDTNIIAYAYGMHLTKLGQASGYNKVPKGKDLQNKVIEYIEEFLDESLADTFKDAFNDGLKVELVSEKGSIRQVLELDARDCSDTIDDLIDEIVDQGYAVMNTPTKNVFRVDFF